MKKLVLFDLDGTILSGISSENAFIIHLLKKRIIRLKQITAYIQFLIKWFSKHLFYTFIKDKAYLNDLPADNIRLIGQKLVKDKLLHKVRNELKTAVENHQNAGDIVVLLTGAYDFMARVFADYLKIEHVEATECIIKDGKFTALPPKKHPFAQEKLNIAKQLSERFGISLENCVAYGNSRNDLFLLDAVGYPVAVHPDRKLRRTAKEKGWVVIK